MSDDGCDILCYACCEHHVWRDVPWVFYEISYANNLDGWRANSRRRLIRRWLSYLVASPLALFPDQHLVPNGERLLRRRVTMRHFLLFVTEHENTENLGERGKNTLGRLN